MHACIFTDTVLYLCLPMLHCSNICSLNVPGPVFSTILTNQEELILTHFKLVLVNRGRKEGNVLFNDALNAFYLRLYGVTHMVKDHSDSEREETRCCHMGYSF